jgi:hypothetical protein
LRLRLGLTPHSQILTRPERLFRDKHSNLFVHSVSGEEKHLLHGFMETMLQYFNFFIIDEVAKYAGVFVFGKPFQPSLLIASEAGACLSGAPIRYFHGFISKYQIRL